MKRAFLLFAATGLIAAAVWASIQKPTLKINGKTASTDVRLIGGKAYVPVNDVARALGMTSSKSGINYVLAIPGGTGQLEGKTQGVIGDMLFDGFWRFQVVAMKEQEGSYTQIYDQHAKTFKPNGPNDKLIVLECVMKNGMKKQVSPILHQDNHGNTALATDDGSSQAPLVIDARQAAAVNSGWDAAPMLPGAQVKLNVVFSIPRSAKPKSLVFSLITYTGGEKPNDVRIELEAK